MIPRVYGLIGESVVGTEVDAAGALIINLNHQSIKIVAERQDPDSFWSITDNSDVNNSSVILQSIK